MCVHAYAAGPHKVRTGAGLGLKGQDVPREGVPRAAPPFGQALEVPGKPWGRCLGELLRKPLRLGVPKGVEMWVGGGWSGLMLSLPHPQKMRKSTSTCLAGVDFPVTASFDF